MKPSSPPVPPAPPAAAAGDLAGRLAETERVLELMTEELAASYESLSAIFRFITDLSRAPNLEAFASERLGELLTVTEADWYVLRITDTRKRELGVYASSRPGWQAPGLPLPPKPCPAASVERRAVEQWGVVWFDAGNPLAPEDPLTVFQSTGGVGLSHPVVAGEQVLGVLTVGRHGTDTTFTAGQANIIQTFADFLGLQLANAHLHESSVQSRLVSRELEIAAGIQRSLLPEQLPQPPGFGLAGSCVTARQVGGDFYDALRIGSDGLLLVIADVMGKGMPAAMFAAVFRSQVRARSDLATRPGSFMTWLNEALCADLNRVDMSITAQLAYVDTAARTVRVASAGHPPLLLAGQGMPVRELGPPGLPLGILRRNPYGEEVLPLPPAVSILLFTDGLTEARHPAGALFGLDALKVWLTDPRLAAQAAPFCCDDLRARLRAFRETEYPADDQAFMFLAEHRPLGAPTS